MIDDDTTTGARAHMTAVAVLLMMLSGVLFGVSMDSMFLEYERVLIVSCAVGVDAVAFAVAYNSWYEPDDHGPSIRAFGV